LPDISRFSKLNLPVDWPKLELSPLKLIVQSLRKGTDRLVEPIIAARTHVSFNLSADALIEGEKALVRGL
jgi:hypothetical protein